jgi:hypothetical protein
MMEKKREPIFNFTDNRLVQTDADLGPILDVKENEQGEIVATITDCLIVQGCGVLHLYQKSVRVVVVETRFQRFLLRFFKVLS